MNSRQMILADRHVALDGWQDDLRDRNKKADLKFYQPRQRRSSATRCVADRCNREFRIAASLRKLAREGINIITPNKE